MQKKKSLWRVKIIFLRTFIRVFAVIPLLGKKAQKNAYKLLTKIESVNLADIPAELQGVRFLFLTDPHIWGSIDYIAGEVQENIKTLIADIDPSKLFVLHGGDFICGEWSDPESTQSTVWVMDTLFGGLESYPNFAVIGNHDEEDIDFPRIKKHLEEKYKMHFMTQPRDTRSLHIGGKETQIHGIHTLLDHLEVMSVTDRNILLDTYIHLLTKSEADFHIVLIHNPDGLEFLLSRLVKNKQTFTKPILFLAGHTHGASINLPLIRRGALRICKTKFKRYKGWYGPKGKYAHTGNWRLYVSTGMGNGPGFDFRLNAHPEVVLFTI